jgi:putative ABC transport system substrate-binding protein
VRRRDFLAGAAGWATVWPFAGRAEQSIAVIGFLGGATPALFAGPLRAFRAGLAEAGVAEGSNVTIEERWAEGRNDRLPDLAADLVSRKVDVIVTVTTPGALAAKAATPTIPIVFAIGSDPVRDGIVLSLRRPGGNVTGVTALIALLVNRRNRQLADSQTAELQAAAARLKRELHVLNAGTDAELDVAFAQLQATKAQGLIISADGFFTSHDRELAALAIQHRIPAVYQNRSFAEAGGLVSYGASTAEAWRLAGVYVSRMLRGEHPADLPVQQATKVELILNGKTAKALGLSMPPSLLARADEVIE